MQHQLCTSQFIIDELARKLSQKFHYTAVEIQGITNLVVGAAVKVEPAPIPDAVCRDPLDIPIIGTALAAKAKLLITVDKDLLTIGEYMGTAIVKPGAFWRQAGT